MLRHRALVALFLVLGLLVVGLVPGVALPVAAQGPGSSSYIIVFNDWVDVDTAVPDVAVAHGLKLGFSYRHALKGMSAVVPAGRLNALTRDPRVKYVAEDLERSTAEQSTPTGVRRILADTNPAIDIDGNDDYRVDVDVAVIDTGIDFQHPDLNVLGGITCSGNRVRARCTDGGDDDHYHGTHVAGTIAALDNGIGVVGVAPGARLWAVKVLDSKGTGYSSTIIAGIDWVTAQADTIEVANMSLGGSGYSQAEYDAIQGAVNAGVAFAVAAGNDDDDADNYSPAAFNNVLTVSALADFDGAPGGLGSPTCRVDQDDTLADFSNWGPEVDVAAPGVCILSTYPLEQGEYGTISGTSMASPHVAGALALLASADNPGNAADVYGLYQRVKSAGNDGWTDDSGDGIQEPLLDVSSFVPVLTPVGGGAPENQPPTASFTYQCTDLACSFDGHASSDSDGSITSYAWDLGDGTAASGASTSHTYAADGTYSVVLTVTDDDGATDSDGQSVIVAAGGGSTEIILEVVRAYVRGVQRVDLAWSGATSANLDVYRDAVLVATTANDGAYTDNTGAKNLTSITYQVCEAGTSVCSNVATAVW